MTLSSAPSEAAFAGARQARSRLHGDLSDEAYAVALSLLPGVGPARMAALLRHWSPSEAWGRVTGGSSTDDEGVRAACGGDRAIGRLWAHVAARTDVAEVWQAHVDAGIRVHLLGGPEYPAALSGDHEAPAVLFSRGAMGVLAARRVAIVGTRQCTRYGRDVARELGHDLAASGVSVVSGLAVGIDGSAHAGAIEALSQAGLNGGRQGPVAVVGSGLDVIYPRRNASLWSDVAATGVILSEAPLGTAPESWRFPVRNRVIAGLAEVVVVVESHARGGSVHTVDAAVARGRPVMAVPGSVRSPASTFTNALLADGCAPVRDALDVLMVLGLSCGSGAGSADVRPKPDPAAQAVLAAMEWEPATLDDIVARSHLAPAEVSVALERLARDGWVNARAGWWEQLPAALARSMSTSRRTGRK